MGASKGIKGCMDLENKLNSVRIHMCPVLKALRWLTCMMFCTFKRHLLPSERHWLLVKTSSEIHRLAHPPDGFASCRLETKMRTRC